MSVKKENKASDSTTKVEKPETHLPVCVGFQRLVLIEGTATVYVASSILDSVKVGTPVAESLGKTLLRKHCVEWCDPDLDYASSPSLCSIEPLGDNYDASDLTYLCWLGKDQDVTILESVDHGKRDDDADD